MSIVKNIVPILFLMSACGDDPDKDTGEDTDTQEDNQDSGLIDRQFLLDSSTGFTPVEGTTVSLTFRGGEIFSMSAGCNTWSGSFAVEDGLLTVVGDGMTEIGCDMALHQQDEWLVVFLSSSPELNLDGDYLTLSTNDAELVFLDSEVATPDLDLVGQTWVVDTFIENEAATAYNLESDPTVTFSGDGTFSMFGGCNEASGEYTVSGADITFSTVVSSAMECMDSSIQEVEMLMFSVFSDGTSSYEIDASRLTVERGSNGISALAE